MDKGNGRVTAEWSGGESESGVVVVQSVKRDVCRRVNTAAE